MINLIKKYRNLSFEKKSLFISKFSGIGSFILAIGKVLFGFITASYFFCIAGLFSLFIGLAKITCSKGLQKKESLEESIQNNKKISFFLCIASLTYIIYMGRLLIFDIDFIQYTMFIGVMIAFVSFLELGFAIYGIIKTKKHGFLYRSLKIINLCQALTAMVLTLVAITSFMEATDTILNAIAGIIVGIVSLIFGIYIWFAPKISIVDRAQNNYHFNVSKDMVILNLENAVNKFHQKKKNNKYKLIVNNNNVLLELYKNKVYGTTIYEAKLVKINNQIQLHGTIKHNFKIGFHVPWYYLTLLIILSEILIFPYLIGYFMLFVRHIFIYNEFIRFMEFELHGQRLNE